MKKPKRNSKKDRPKNNDVHARAERRQVNEMKRLRDKGYDDYAISFYLAIPESTVRRKLWGK